MSALPVSFVDGAPPGVVSAAGIRLALFSETYPPQLNGVARTLERLVDTVVARGGEARVFTTTDPHAEPDERVHRWASVRFPPYPHLRLAWPGTRGVVRALREFRPTIVHAATPFGMGLAARAAARSLGVPFVTSYHTSFTEYARFYGLGALSRSGWRFLRWFHNGGARTYAPSAAVAAELAAHGFGKLAVWGRGVDAERFHPAYRSLSRRASLGVREGEVLVLYVGRIAREKGLDTALAAIRRLSTEPARRLRFVFVGDGPYLEDMRRCAPGSAIFTGRRVGRELSELYASADLFVFPSTTDTFGNVLLEAMASGVPIVAADAGPTRELLADGGGVLVPPADDLALAAVLLRLAADPAARVRHARAGLASSWRRSWSAVFDALLTDYRAVCAASNPAGSDDGAA